MNDLDDKIMAIQRRLISDRTLFASATEAAMTCRQTRSRTSEFMCVFTLPLPT
jgi:hypothetical protein